MPFVAESLVAEWPSGLGKGLQSPVHGFDSRLRLSAFPHGRKTWALARALGAWLDQAGFIGEHDHLDPVAQPELGENPSDV
jgi:hypothetical protein